MGNLEARGGQSGRGRAGVPCATRESPGVPGGGEAAGFQVSSFSEKADIENCSGDDRLVPEADPEEILLSGGCFLPFKILPPQRQLLSVKRSLSRP